MGWLLVFFILGMAFIFGYAMFSPNSRFRRNNYVDPQDNTVKLGKPKGDKKENSWWENFWKG